MKVMLISPEENIPKYADMYPSGAVLLLGYRRFIFSSGAEPRFANSSRSLCLTNLFLICRKKTMKILIVALLLLISCGRRAEISITIAGSTSIHPFAEKLAEEYMLRHPQVQLNVQAGGSTVGIQAVMRGIADIGMSSRELREDEKHLCRIPIANEGIAMVVNPKNPLDDIRLEEIKKIFSGEIANWKELGWENKPITCITREEGSGTRGSFEKLVMGETRITLTALVQDSNGSVREVVVHDPYAIGYISLSFVDERVKALKIDGVAPTPKNIMEGKYGLVRPFLFVLKAPPTGEVKKFIDFVLSKEGQELLSKEGLLPPK